MLRNATWADIGTDIKTANSMTTALALSGLDYDVVKMPVQLPDGTIIPNRFATVRPDPEGGLRTYDVVSDKFEIIQNREAFDFVDYMSEDLIFERAGETMNGMVYIIARMAEVSILGDTFTPHVIFRNGFSGKVKISAAICPLRVVCQNQFNFAFKDTANSINVRHVRNAEAKLQEAREVLRVSADYMGTLSRRAELLAGQKLSPEQVGRVMDIMFPMADIETMNPYKRTRILAARVGFERAYNQDDNSNFRGTAWGLVNAYTDYLTHRASMGNTDTRDEGRFMTTTFGPAAMNGVLDAIEIVA